MRSITKGPWAAALALLLGAAGCGGGSGGTPTAPPAPTPAPSVIDLTGTWAEATGGDITWRLTQTGTSVTGTSAFSQNSGPHLGAVSGSGVISGTVSSTTFSLTDTYATLSKANCSMRVTAEMSINGNSMSGRYNETDTCDGVVLGTESGPFTMRRQ